MKTELVKEGTIRLVKRFAFLPITIGYIRIWWETVYIQQKFHEYIGDEFTGAWNIWVNEKFISKEEYFINQSVCL